jgi:hypothetical protein
MATRVTQRAKPVVFSPMQRHPQTFEIAMIVICLLCILAGVLIAKATDWGVTTRP